MSRNRWSIWIDVEGFSTVYSTDEVQAICALGDLMEAIYRVGSTVFSKAPDRLFVHQFGDGFIIVSDFPEDRPDRPLAICVAIMRHLLSRGVVTKAAIAGGGFADIGSCYPDIVLQATTDRRYVKLGEGVMTIMSVMGTALTTAHGLASRRSGAVLLFEPLIFANVPEGVTILQGAPTAIDWVHSHFPKINEICEQAGLIVLEPQMAESLLIDYIQRHQATLPKHWVDSTTESLHLSR